MVLLQLTANLRLEISGLGHERGQASICKQFVGLDKWFISPILPIIHFSPTFHISYEYGRLECTKWL